MSRIFVIIAKSSTGKDTIFKSLVSDCSLPLKTVVSYTTRPIRAGEKEGTEYHFTDIPTFEAMKKDGKVIEYRCYHTVHGDWYYFTADDGQIELEESDYLLIMTLEGFEQLRKYYGEEHVVPIYIEADGFERLSRAMLREKKEANPSYAEVCRRFLADEADFSEDNIERLGIVRRFRNTEHKLEDCVQEVSSYIRSFL